jgi:hypothetical protein
VGVGEAAPRGVPVDWASLSVHGVEVAGSGVAIGWISLSVQGVDVGGSGVLVERAELGLSDAPVGAIVEEQGVLEYVGKRSPKDVAVKTGASLAMKLSDAGTWADSEGLGRSSSNGSELDAITGASVGITVEEQGVLEYTGNGDVKGLSLFSVKAGAILAMKDSKAGSSTDSYGFGWSSSKGIEVDTAGGADVVGGVTVAPDVASSKVGSAEPEATEEDTGP